MQDQRVEIAVRALLELMLPQDRAALVSGLNSELLSLPTARLSGHKEIDTWIRDAQIATMSWQPGFCNCSNGVCYGMHYRTEFTNSHRNGEPVRREMNIFVKPNYAAFQFRQSTPTGDLISSIVNDNGVAAFYGSAMGARISHLASRVQFVRWLAEINIQ